MGEQRYSSTILDLARDGGESSDSHPHHFTSGERVLGAVDKRKIS
jgi:hypothetical protein